MKRGRGMKKNTSWFFFTRCERIFVLIILFYRYTMINRAERRCRPLTTNKKKTRKKQEEEQREKSRKEVVVL
jgi:hypothetical protein